MGKGSSIQNRIIISIASVAIISTLIIATFNWQVNASLFKNEVNIKLTYLHENYTNYVEEYFSQVIKSIDILEYQILNEIDKDRLHDKAYLNKFVEQLAPTVKNLAMNSLTGKTAYVYFSPKLTNETFDIYYADQDDMGEVTRQAMLAIEYYDTYDEDITKDWWFKPIESQKSYWSDPYEWRLDNGKIVNFFSYTRPIYIDDELICVAGADLRYDDLKDIIQSIEVYETGYFFLLNDKFEILIDNFISSAEIPQNIDASRFEFIGTNLDALKAEVVVDSNSSPDKFFVYSQLQNGWIIGLEANKAEIMENFTRYQLISLFFFAVMIIVFLFISFKLGAFISKPIRELVEAIDNVEEEQLKIIVPDTCLCRNDDIGVLSRVLLNMSNRLDETFIKLNLQNKELMAEIDQRVRIQTELDLMSEVISNTTDAMFIADQHFNLIYTNHSFSQSTCGTIDDLTGNVNLKQVLKLDSEGIETIKASGFFGEFQVVNNKSEEHTVLLMINKVYRNDEFYYLGLFKDLTEEKIKDETIDHLKNYDVLTNLGNRRHLEAYVTRLIEEDDTKLSFALMLINVNSFRIINETLGFKIGNKVLVEMSKRLSKLTSGKSIVTRFNGDEFALLKMTDLNMSDIYNYVKEMNDRLESVYLIDEKRIFIQNCVGISIYPTDGSTYEELIKASTTALNYLKENKNFSFQFYNEKINEITINKYKIENGLRHALEREEFQLLYQPQVDINSNKVVGVEALLRWHSMEGLVSPTVFIPIAEESRLILPIGEFVLKTACDVASRIEALGYDLIMSVNISAVQFKSNYFVEMISSILKTSLLNPNKLELEITEGILMDNEVECSHLIKELKSFGIRISIDDFGTGYSSLAYLRNFSVDKIKIDRSFIMDIPSKDDGMIANSIIQLSRNLGLEVVAEGVETIEQIHFLKENECAQVQGYYYSKPITEKELIAYIKTKNTGGTNA